MPWARKLSAGDFAFAFSDRQQDDPAWQYAVELMMKAPKEGSSAADLQDAERSL